MRSDNNKKSRFEEYLKRVAFGCFTVIPRLLLTQPFETTLARVQAEPNLTVSEVVKKVLQNKGVKGFYDGAIPTASRYLAMKFFGVPVMTYSYNWSKTTFSEEPLNNIAPPLITATAMAGHDWLAISYMNYKFFQQTLNSKVESKTLIEAARCIYDSSRAIPVLQAYRWLSFLGTREMWKRNCGDAGDSFFYMLGSAVFSASAHCLGVPFLERLNNAVNKDSSNKGKSILDIAKYLYKAEGIKEIYKRASPFVFINSGITLLLWDIILSTYGKEGSKEMLQKEIEI